MNQIEKDQSDIEIHPQMEDTQNPPRPAQHHLEFTPGTDREG